VAKALAICGSSAGVPVLIEEAQGILSKVEKIRAKQRGQPRRIPADMGAVPHVVFLLYARPSRR